MKTRLLCLTFLIVILEIAFLTSFMEKPNKLNRYRVIVSFENAAKSVIKEVDAENISSIFKKINSLMEHERGPNWRKECGEIELITISKDRSEK